MLTSSSCLRPVYLQDHSKSLLHSVVHFTPCNTRRDIVLEGDKASVSGVFKGATQTFCEVI